MFWLRRLRYESSLSFRERDWLLLPVSVKSSIRATLTRSLLPSITFTTASSTSDSPSATKLSTDPISSSLFISDYKPHQEFSQKVALASVYSYTHSFTFITKRMFSLYRARFSPRDSRMRRRPYSVPTYCPFSTIPPSHFSAGVY